MAEGTGQNGPTCVPCWQGTEVGTTGPQNGAFLRAVLPGQKCPFSSQNRAPILGHYYKAVARRRARQGTANFRAVVELDLGTAKGQHGAMLFSKLAWNESRHRGGFRASTLSQRGKRCAPATIKQILIGLRTDKHATLIYAHCHRFPDGRTREQRSLAHGATSVGPPKRTVIARRQSHNLWHSTISLPLLGA